ncbi:MAG: M48 family metallopeptidase [Hyphomicrobiaceae bacterium]
MRSLILWIIRTLGRYTAIGLFALWVPVFIAWLSFFDQTGGVRYGLLALPVMLPLTMASVTLLLGVLFAGTRRAPGPYVGRTDASGLWAMWDELAPPKWNQTRLLRIDDRFNASISERSRFFGLGFPEVTMTIGLPMLHALDAKYVRAVVAHEVGHDACRHTQGLTNLVEFERTLELVFAMFPPGITVTGTILWKLLGWLGDWLTEEHLRLSRSAEREADAKAAKAIGREAYAESLAVFAAHCERYGEVFVKPIHDGLGRLMHVPPSPLDTLFAETVGPTPGELTPFAQAAYAKPHDKESTHPVLAEGLAAVGCAQLPAIKPLGPRATLSLVSPEAIEAVREACRARWERTIRRHLQLD